jgi:hypothetical protein
VQPPTTPSARRCPELATCKAFDDAVRRSLTHLADPTKLATSPLLKLRVVAAGVADARQEDTRLQRAAVLRALLLDLLEAMRPANGRGPITGDAWRFYNCLYYPYVGGISRRRASSIRRQLQERRARDGTACSDLDVVVAWLMQLDEGTYFRWQRRGSDSIAAALREGERAAGGVVPEEDSADAACATAAPACVVALEGNVRTVRVPKPPSGVPVVGAAQASLRVS